MAFFNNARALRAAILACGMVWLGPAGISVAGPAGIPYGRSSTLNSDEPFGLYTTPVYSGGLLRKWLGVAHKLEDERVQLALCDGDRERCVSEAALKFLRIVDRGRQRDGRARVGEINHGINLAIRPMEDLAQYGEVDAGVRRSSLSTQAPAIVRTMRLPNTSRCKWPASRLKICASWSCSSSMVKATPLPRFD
jgi:hypothetical protein